MPKFIKERLRQLILTFEAEEPFLSESFCFFFARRYKVKEFSLSLQSAKTGCAIFAECEASRQKSFRRGKSLHAGTTAQGLASGSLEQ
ncbi:MAG: hypothetical protein LBR34_02790 [Prevotella sp.]|nr:hypothetical protein [Prevotella sp.]